MKKELKLAKEIGVKRLLSTVDDPIDNDNILASAGLWPYRRPLTLPAVQNHLHSSISVSICV